MSCTSETYKVRYVYTISLVTENVDAGKWEFDRNPNVCHIFKLNNLLICIYIVKKIKGWSRVDSFAGIFNLIFIATYKIEALTEMWVIKSQGVVNISESEIKMTIQFSFFFRFREPLNVGMTLKKCNRNSKFQVYKIKHYQPTERLKHNCHVSWL